MGKVEVLQICTRCGNYATKSSLVDRFYISYSELHKNSGRVHICKECVADLSTVGTEFREEKLFEVLKMIDRQYVHSLVEASIYEVYGIMKEDEPDLTVTAVMYKYGKEIVGKYMKNSSMNQHNGKTFSSGETELYFADDGSIQSEKIVDEYNIPELREKYGYGYEDEEYKNFERKYKKITKTYKEKTDIHTENLITYITHKVKEEMASAKGDIKNAEVWSKMADKDAVRAGIAVNKMSKSDLTGGIDVVSQIFDATESESGLIPWIPVLLDKPSDEADLIIWSIINYGRRLEEKPTITYREVWEFYDEMLIEYLNNNPRFKTQEEVDEYIKKRHAMYRDLEKVYPEPLYNETDEEEEGELNA